MKKAFQILSGIGTIFLLIIAILTTKDPFESLEGLTMISTGYPKFMINWIGFCMVYLGIIWGIYFILDKITKRRSKKYDKMYLLKEGVFMKKKFLCAFVLMACFLLTACGSNLSSGSLKLNETKEKGDWKMTMKKIEYSDGYCKVLNDKFLTSSETYMKDDTEYICTQEEPKNNKKFLLFELDLEYIGKNKISEYMEDFLLNYNDGYEVSPESVYISANKEYWLYIDGDAVNHNEVSIDPLETTKFTIRGAFEISEKIEKDTNSNLILELPFNFKYKVR